MSRATLHFAAAALWTAAAAMLIMQSFYPVNTGRILAVWGLFVTAIAVTVTGACLLDLQTDRLARVIHLRDQYREINGGDGTVSRIGGE